MFEKSLPVIKALLTMHDEFEKLKGDAAGLADRVSRISERVATIEGRMDSFPQIVKAAVDDRLMEVSRRGKRLPR